MKNKADLLYELMCVLGRNAEHAKKQVDNFIYELRKSNDIREAFDEDPNHPDGWYRKFEKQNKRK